MFEELGLTSRPAFMPYQSGGATSNGSEWGAAGAAVAGAGGAQGTGCCGGGSQAGAGTPKQAAHGCGCH